MGSHTERLHVGSGVVPVQTRTPVVLGQSAATLTQMAPDRVVLGIGLSSRAIVGDWHGLAFAPALQQIREAVQIIRMVAAGERVNFEGKFYRVKNFRLGAPPPSKPVRVVLAALGPEMLELAGEIAAGLGVVGPAAFCRERIAEFARAGLTQPVIVPFAPGAGSDARAAQLRTLRAFP